MQTIKCDEHHSVVRVGCDNAEFDSYNQFWVCKGHTVFSEPENKEIYRKSAYELFLAAKEFVEIFESDSGELHERVEYRLNEAVKNFWKDAP